MKLSNGHTYKQLEGQEKENFQKYFPDFAEKAIVLQPGGWVVLDRYLKFEQRITNLKLGPKDVLIMTYPKCGTTWTQEIVWTMLNNPDLNNEDAKVHLFARSPFVEADMLFPPKPPTEGDEASLSIIKKFMEVCPGKNPEDGVMVQLAENYSGRRTIKTHLPLSLFSPDLLSSTKIIFVARNPKDACLSYEHHHRVLKDHTFTGTRETFVDYFVKDRLLYGSFAEMVKEAWAVQDHPNMHFVFYEDLKADIDGELKKINDFIGAGLTEQQLKNVKEHTSISSMRKNDPMKFEQANFYNEEQFKKEGGFFRKGETGGWRSKLTEEDSAKIDDYVKKHFEGTGLTFKF